MRPDRGHSGENWFGTPSRMVLLTAAFFLLSIGIITTLLYIPKQWELAISIGLLACAFVVAIALALWMREWRFLPVSIILLAVAVQIALPSGSLKGSSWTGIVANIEQTPVFFFSTLILFAICYLGGLAWQSRRYRRLELERAELLKEREARIRRLNCLYGVSRLASNCGASVDDVAEGAAELLRTTLGNSGEVCAAIRLGSTVYGSTGPCGQSNKIVSPIREHGRQTGTVELGQTGNPTDETRQEFFRDGRPLAEAVAERLGKILERLKAEHLLQVSEAKFRALFDGVGDAVFIHDFEGRIVEVNHAACRRMGYSREMMLGMTLSDIEKPAHPAFLSERMARMNEDPESIFETSHMRRDGSTIPIEMNCRVIQYGAQRVVLSVARDVSTRKKMEEVLRAKDERFRELYHNAQVGLYRTRIADGQVVECNARLAQMFGYDDAELFKREFVFSHHYTDIDVRKRMIERLKERGQLINQDASLTRRDGSLIWIRYSARILPDEGCLEGFMFDITEQREAEEALLQSEKRMRALLKAQPDMIFHLSPERTFEDFYAADASALLLPPDQFLGRGLDEIFSGPLLEQFYAAIDEVTATGRMHVFEYQLSLPDRLAHFEARISPYGEGEIVAIVRDITERKRTEEQLMKLAAAVDQTAEYIIITDPDGIIQYVNPAFEKVTGYRSDQVIGRTPRFLRSDRHDRAFYRNLWRTIRKGEVWTGRIINRRSDGTFFQEEATVSPVRDAEGRIVNYVAVARDITEQLQLEEQLRQAQKMEAVGQLAGGIAHDFNNLLQGIQGYTQMAMIDLAVRGETNSDLEQVMMATERASILIRQLLTFSRRQSIQPKFLDLNRIISNLMSMLRRVIGEQIELRFEPGQDLMSIYADPGQIEQMLMNLCVNARDAIEGDGAITIHTENRILDAAFCESNPWASPGQFVYLSLSDTGCGIPEEFVDRIFDPFFTTKEVGKGSGLGLSIVYGVIKQHDGLINVVSHPGLGTNMEIYLPLAARPSDHDEAWRKPTPIGGGNEAILLAEDDKLVRELTTEVLQRGGYRVYVARDGQSAIDLFDQIEDQIDMAVLDAVMPKLSGRAVYERIHALRPDIPILFCSGYSTIVLGAEFVRNEAVEVLPKPYSPADLLSKVREMLDRSKCVKP